MVKFINPANILAQVGLQPGNTVADFGCGGGYFTVPAGKMVGSDGMVYGVDIMPDRLAVTQSAARHAGLKNVNVVRTDLAKPLTGIAPSSCDLVVISNIVHQIQSRDALFANVYTVLKTGGKVLAVEWKKEYTPLGPSQDTRVGSEELTALCTAKGLRLEKQLEADGYHYALLFTK